MMPEYRPAISLSICMIVRNEEAVLARCLESVRGAWDQLVIIDTGSEDSTVEIARRYTPEVYREPWENDFGKARNSSFSRARCDYIMYLDADDVLPDAEREKLLRLKRDLAAMPEAERPRTLLMPYDVPEAGGVSFRSRMVARHEGPYWTGAIHECMCLEDPTLQTDILFLHRKLVQPPKDRNCNIIRAIPRETLRRNFWLSAQCFLDMTLEGHPEEAEEYFRMCAEAEKKIPDTCLQLASTLNHHQYWEQALRWVRLAETIPETAPESGADPAALREITVLLYQQGVKACVRMDLLDEATAYNDKVLEIAPENRAAAINRIILEKKKKEIPPA